MAGAASGGCVMSSCLLAHFVCPYLPGPQHRLYRYQIDSERRVIACRGYCGHSHMCSNGRFQKGHDKLVRP
ncbi:hypothetical protein P153DRAFT_96679 [Dothidotthia symphoricarpi CBS 119687]|uniref:Uncharacterized protein n=1 Tax=Dothidotthia symphoricarpi CBS 119687 TaxID=1392245 RepID=A0A6A6AT02_9PLEO|nr:uncharacterized protein P153DRAFT_96679 [Dothidotthia symphoricarpi CBS 119687]KAF2133671.1 hypothetical protein P153DRAFT_96679 [Dothidotthia symphoricarpi CBS 119687]